MLAGKLFRRKLLRIAGYYSIATFSSSILLQVNRQTKYVSDPINKLDFNLVMVRLLIRASFWRKMVQRLFEVWRLLEEK